MVRVLNVALLVCAALPGPSVTAATPAWSNTITLTKGGHLLGNPGAEVRLTEYVSYSCAKCTRYNIESDAVLRLAYIPSGRLAIEVHLLAENPVDLTAAMLAKCGPKERFFLNHNALLRSQAKWLPLLASATPAQRQRWSGADLGTRNRAIAADLKLYEAMATRGYDRLTLERCLNDQALAAQVTAQSAAARAAGVTQTPGFSINGKLLQHTTDWAGLRPQLDESLR